MKDNACADIWLDVKCLLAEGPVWYRDHLYWVDIDGERLYRAHTGEEKWTCWTVGAKIGAAVPVDNGLWIMAREDGLSWFDPKSGEIRHAADFPEPHLPHNRFNDGKCDPSGRLWVGTMSMRKEKGAGSLYRIAPDMKLERMLDGITTSNGLAWSADGKTMFYIDTPTRRIDAFDYDLQRGTIDNRRCIIDLHDEQGRPDGMCIDQKGVLWVALWSGWSLLGIDPVRGIVIKRIQLPVENVTSCCFGGHEMQELFITTARAKDDDTANGQPLAGGVFRIRMDNPGFAVVPMKYQLP